MTELEYVIEKASEIYTDDGVAAWIDAPNDLFAGQTPRELVTEGRTDEVLDVIETLANGAFM